jgi:hypothetical protein
MATSDLLKKWKTTKRKNFHKIFREGPNVAGPKWNPETAAQAQQIETTR